MKVEIGEKIRELCRQYNRTQEDLATALGVTSQAVSRWEANGGYPDMELIPSIANYFGISIDTLFGFEADRDRKITEIIARKDAFGIKGRSDDHWVDECVEILREGLARLIQLYLYLSRLQWERGYHDDAFASLDLALEHAKGLEAIYNNGSEHSFTAPLVSFVKYTPDSTHATESPARIAKLLPDDWPFWCNPDCSQIEKEIKADPRWAKWVERTQGN